MVCTCKKLGSHLTHVGTLQLKSIGEGIGESQVLSVQIMSAAFEEQEGNG